MKRLFALVTTAALVLGACGGDDKGGAPATSADAKAQFAAAFDALGQSPGQTVTLSLNSDLASLQALAGEDGSQLAEADAQKILGSSMRISAKNTTDPNEAAAQIVFNVAGTDAIELRQVGYSLYLHVEAASLAETFGQDPAILQGLGQQAAAGGFGFVKDALDGKWLALEGLDKLTESLTGQAPQAATAEQAAILAQFAELLKNSGEVGSQGDDAIGTHLVATFPIRTLYQGLLDLTAGLGQSLPSGAALPPIGEVPDESITLDVWVKDGKVVQIVFDFIQLGTITDDPAPAGVTTFGLKIALAEFSGAVEVPADAVKIDPNAIFGALLGGLGGTGGGGYGGGGGGNKSAGYDSDFPCEMLEGEPKEVLEQFKDECPELQKK